MSNNSVNSKDEYIRLYKSLQEGYKHEKNLKHWLENLPNDHKNYAKVVAALQDITKINKRLEIELAEIKKINNEANIWDKKLV